MGKKRGVPLWKLLIDLSPQQIINTLDFSYLEDELTKEQALQLLQTQSTEKLKEKKLLKQVTPVMIHLLAGLITPMRK
jgi:L-fuconate dehydratase